MVLLNAVPANTTTHSAHSHNTPPHLRRTVPTSATSVTPCPVRKFLNNNLLFIGYFLFGFLLKCIDDVSKGDVCFNRIWFQ